MQKIKKINLTFIIKFAICIYLIIDLITNIVKIYKESNINEEFFSIDLRESYEQEYNQMTEEERRNSNMKPVEEITDIELERIRNLGYIYAVGIILVLAVGVTLFKNIQWILLLVVVKQVNKKIIKEKLTNIDFKKTQNYYREIIEGYSMGELAYIDSFELNYQRIIIAEMLQLEKENKIKIENGKIKLVENTKLDKLKKSQMYIIEYIKNDKIGEIDKYILEQKIKQEALNDELIKEKKDLKKRMIKKILKSILIFIILIIIYTKLMYNGEFLSYSKSVVLSFLYVVTMFICFIALIIYPIYKFIYYVFYNFKYKEDPYFRTKKGNKLNEKIEGLKQYLKQYSLLNEKKRKELVLWEDYLCYSVLFGQNNKIIEEYEKYI